jgi:hypothetical protein
MDQDWGQLLFEQRMPWGVLSAIVALGLFVVGAAATTRQPVSVAIGVGLAVFLWVGAAADPVAGCRGHRCFESGLTRRTLFGRRGLAYADVAAIQYEARAVVFWGKHRRTRIRIRLVAGRPLRAVDVRVVVRAGEEGPLEAVHDIVAGLVASKVAAGYFLV